MKIELKKFFYSVGLSKLAHASKSTPRKNLGVNKFSSIILMYLILENNLFKIIHADSFSNII